MEKIELPIPPSVNLCYSNNPITRGRFKTKKYKDWEYESAIVLNSQPKIRITGDEWLEVFYEFHFPIYNKNGTKKKKDTANFEKPLSDFLEKNIEGFEDHKIKKMNLQKIDSSDQKVIISLQEI